MLAPVPAGGTAEAEQEQVVGGGFKCSRVATAETTPYGPISAINMDKGEIVWQVPNGETPDFIRNNPALKGISVPNTGQPGYDTGTLVTKTLVIQGDPQFTTTSVHPRGDDTARLR